MLQLCNDIKDTSLSKALISVSAQLSSPWTTGADDIKMLKIKTCLLLDKVICFHCGFSFLTGQKQVAVWVEMYIRWVFICKQVLKTT